MSALRFECMQAMEFSFQMESVIRGHHVSKTVWTPFVGEVLSLSPESGNEHDRFAVSGGVGAKLNVVCSAIDPPNTYRRAAAERLPRSYGLRSNTA